MWTVNTEAEIGSAKSTTPGCHWPDFMRLDRFSLKETFNFQVDFERVENNKSKLSRCSTTMAWSSKTIFVACQNQHARSLAIIVTHCFSLGEWKKKKEMTNYSCEVTQLMPWHETVPSIPCMGNEILYFPWTVWLRAPGPLLSCCRGLSLSRWTKPNHGGVECWPMRCLRQCRNPTPEEQGNADRWKSCQREWILGHKCLARFFFFFFLFPPPPWASWELHGSTSFSPLWKLNEKIRGAQSTHFLYAKKSRGTCVLKRESFFSLFDCHLNVLASAERSCPHHCLRCRGWVCEHKPTAISLDLEQMMNYIFLPFLNQMGCFISRYKIF